MSDRDDKGYALVAAVTAVAVFGYIAFQTLAADRGGIALAAARQEQAKLMSAAEAGVALAVHGLAADDLAARWSIDGRRRRLEFDGIDLTVTVEDERGKAPLSGLNDAQARALFAGAGASGDRLDALVAEFRDWQTDANQPADASGSVLPPPPGAPLVRHGPFRTVGELSALQDMDSATFARIAPAVTVFFENSGPFEPDHASPLAKAAMSADDLANPDQLDNEASVDNQKTDEQIQDESLIGRTLTVGVVARDTNGAQARRSEIIELTGDKTQPYWVRYTE